MKRMLTCFVFLLFMVFVTNVFSLVNTTLNFVYQTNGATTGEIYFEVWDNATASDHNVSSYANQIKMSSNLTSNFVQVDFYNQRFFAPNYTAYEARVGATSNIVYQYTYNSGIYTAITVTPVKICDIKITYNIAGGTGTISWSDTPSDFAVVDDGANPVTGTRGSIDSELSDFSLPVELTTLTASYDAGKGVTITWLTQSEVNCLGFHVLRSESENGPYEQITTSMIPGHGNTSSHNQYAYTDNQIVQGKTYWYQVQEVSLEGNDLLGPIFINLSNVPQAPSAFHLGQNFPNPFNPATRINYNIPNETFVSLKVYDLMGHEVKTLVNEVQPAGPNSVVWNGTDNHGHLLSSGIYFYKIKVGDEIRVGKMMKLE
jgi:hypothetical protein